VAGQEGETEQRKLQVDLRFRSMNMATTAEWRGEQRAKPSFKLKGKAHAKVHLRDG
jgi:hypothetical protein